MRHDKQAGMSIPTVKGHADYCAPGNPVCEPRELGSVRRLLDVLGRDLEGLESAISGLRDLIAPALRAAEPANGGKCEGASACCPIGDVVHARCTLVGSLTAQVQDLIERLDI